ncbi:hypothetical protein ECC09_01020 [Helicobacter pylori]|nr:hypothetical protein ECC09_01020 [Helicobacter pylori]
MSFLGSFCFKKMPFLQSIAKGLPKVSDKASDNLFFLKINIKISFCFKNVLRNSFKIRSLGFFREKSFFKLRLP